MRGLRMLVLGAAILLPAPAAAAGQREVAVVIDTSRSMVENDPRRYTSILAQVIGDLLADDEELTLVRMPLDGGMLSLLLGGRLPTCSDGPDPQLAIQLRAGRRDWFKQRANQLLSYDTGTYFAAPIRTALQALKRSSAADKLLLVIADSGGLGDCDEVLTRELRQAARDGVKIASINLGQEAGAFESNPAFELNESATDADGLARAVATVYQRLLGVKKIQTGQVAGGRVSFEVEPHVRDAYLVVLADGEVGGLEPAAGAPSAAELELDFRGGGEAIGLDGRRRTYRMVHLSRPAGGTWEFELPQLSGRKAGWLLIQDSAVGLRQVAAGPVRVGQEALLEVELFDQDTGQSLQGDEARTFSSLTADIGGREVPLRDDGADGDRAAGDGVFSVRIPSPQKGDTWKVRGKGDFLERELEIVPEVADGVWTVEPDVPPAVKAGEPALVEAKLVPEGQPGPPPAALDGQVGGKSEVQLKDDGQNGDRVAGDGTYGGTTQLETPGEWPLTFTDPATGRGLPVRGPAPTVRVRGKLDLGQPPAAQFAELRQGGTAESWLDLSAGTVTGSFDFTLKSDLESRGLTLEIDPGDGFRPLAGALLRVDADHRRFRLRARAGECPQAIPAGAGRRLLLATTDADGAAVEVAVPLALVVVPEPWLVCWWPFLSVMLAGLAGVFTFHGFWAPSRFPARMGLQISPEQDLGEGFFHPFRAQRGSGSGFHRDARLFLHSDFRLSGRSGGALARLRADGRKIALLPLGEVWRLDGDGTWELLAGEEKVLRMGTLHRNAQSTLFFELRNGSTREI